MTGRLSSAERQALAEALICRGDVYRAVEKIVAIREAKVRADVKAHVADTVQQWLYSVGMAR